MRIHLVRSPFGLTAATDDDRELIKSLDPNNVYYVEVKQSRNYHFLCKYMKLFRIAWEYQNEDTQSHFGSMDEWRKTVEVMAGNIEFEYSIEYNDWIPRSKSIAFDKMEEKEFQDLYERVKYILFTKWLPEGVDDDFFEALRDF